MGQIFIISIYNGSVFEKVLSIIVVFFKYFLFILSFFYFKILLKNNLINENTIKNICLFNFIIIIINMTIGLFGFGFPVYSSSDSDVSVGVKGYFFAGNELSAVYVLLSSIVIAFFVADIKKKSSIYILLFTLFIYSALLATKTATGGILILSIATIIFRKKYIEKTPFDLKSIFIVTFSSVSVTLVSIYFFMQSEAYERMKYYYNELSNIYKFLMSGRDQFLTRKIFLFTSENSAFKFFFGMGEHTSVEMDFFDTFLTFGTLGILSIYLIYLVISLFIIYSYQKNTRSFKGSILNVTLLLLFIQSFVSGHVLYSGMAGIFYGMIMALSLNLSQKNIETEMKPFYIASCQNEKSRFSNH